VTPGGNVTTSSIKPCARLRILQNRACQKITRTTKIGNATPNRKATGPAAGNCI
jgi:hypothetical protein